MCLLNSCGLEGNLKILKNEEKKKKKHLSFVLKENEAGRIKCLSFSFEISFARALDHLRKRLS